MDQNRVFAPIGFRREAPILSYAPGVEEKASYYFLGLKVTTDTLRLDRESRRILS
jgi:hypothetical protein